MQQVRFAPMEPAVPFVSLERPTVRALVQTHGPATLTVASVVTTVLREHPAAQVLALRHVPTETTVDLVERNVPLCKSVAMVLVKTVHRVAFRVVQPV